MIVILSFSSKMGLHCGYTSELCSEYKINHICCVSAYEQQIVIKSKNKLIQNSHAVCTHT